MSLNFKRFNSSSMPGQKIAVNGLQIHYERIGNGNHTVLLLPGAFGTSRLDFSKQLTDTKWLDKFTLIAWDPPGYGYSSPPEKNFTDFFRTDAKIAAQLMQTLAIDKYSLLGWSDGGTTAMILAANQPLSVQKLVIWGSKAYVNDKDRQMYDMLKDADNWNPKIRKTFSDYYTEKLFLNYVKLYNKSIVNYSDFCTNDIKQIRQPTLILHGDRDPVMGIEHPFYLINNIIDSKLYRFSNGSHNIHKEFNDEFREIL
ncbi:valacyclovir hydrolase-like [Oppia nitens]|uniref:valacyclovir hydrolase-like n=1 Tax=Oppia nitens TaxID=1686743 RepID=UPI0023DA58DB|nr:valacyclovir hydrolase-like [Oppia nitens]